MNIIALAMLLSSLGSVMVLSPEPMLIKSPGDGESPLQAAKEAAQGTLLKAEETAGSVRDTVVEGVTRPVGKWFRKKPEPEDQLAAARAKAAEAKHAFEEASAQLRDAAVGKLGSTAEAAKDKAVDSGKYVGDKAHQAAGGIKNAAETAGEWVGNGANAAYNKAGSVKESVTDATAHALDAAADTFEWAKEGTYDAAQDAKDDVHNAGVAAKDRTLDAAEYAKDEVTEGVGNARDAVVDNVVLGVDKSKGTAIDAAEKAKETGEYAAHETKDAGHGILGKMKDAACKTKECLLARAHEAGSFLPFLGQGVGYVYNDAKTAGDDIASSAKKTASNAAENVGESVKGWTRDGDHNILESARRSADSLRDRVGRHYRENLDSATDTAEGYYDEGGRRYMSARDYYGEPSQHYYRGVDGRRRYRDAPSRFYDMTRDEAEDYYDWVKYRTRRAYRGARDRAGDYYEDVRDRVGGYIPGRQEEDTGDYYGASRQRAGDRDTRGDYFESSKLKPNQDLGAVVESMGWRRVGVVSPDHVSVSSPKDVVIGDVKYVWQGIGRPPTHVTEELHDTVFRHPMNGEEGAAHTLGEKLGLVKDHAKEGAESVKEGGKRAKDQAYDTLRAPVDSRGRRGDLPNHPEYDDSSAEDDSVITKGTRDLKERVRNAGQAFEAQRSKAGEYADEAREELATSVGLGKDRKISHDGGRSLRTWKDVFFRKPVGFLLAATRALHLLTFSTVYGSGMWMTFVSGLILSKHIPRQQFGYVQSRMFPVYLRILALGQGLLLLLYSILNPWFSAESVERVQLLNFAVMIASTLLNAYVLEPRATKAMFEKLKLEKEEGRGVEDAGTVLTSGKQLMSDHKKKLASVNEHFSMLQGFSSALNLISLGGLTCHLWHLANRLVV